LDRDSSIEISFGIASGLSGLRGTGIEYMYAQN
jgi:hypothetical protein